jgi:hypothetical protein
MDLLPGIIIAIGYFTYQFIYSSKEKIIDDNSADHSSPKILILLLRCVVYSAIIGLAYGLFGAYKIKHLSDSKYPVDLIFNTVFIILILFGDKVVLYVLRRLRFIATKN